MKKKLYFVLSLLFTGFLISAPAVCRGNAKADSSSLGAAEPGTYPGVDEVVVERYAKAAGVKPCEPLINTDRGDLLLFLFLISGIGGGFLLGYLYRALLVEKSDIKNSRSYNSAE